MGTIYIASMISSRAKNHKYVGKWASPPHKNIIKLNVTSFQAKNNKNRLDFSPMTKIEGKYKGYYCFENYWQAGKQLEKYNTKTSKWEDLDLNETKRWWMKQDKPRRKFPSKFSIHVKYADFGNGPLNYIDSRKQVYIPEYYELISSKLDKWKETLKSGKDIVIYDFDGPKKFDGEPLCLPLTLDLLKEKVNYEGNPFGHGYIVGASILNINYDQYI